MIGFRFDANKSVATGHMFRCLAVAEQLKKLGEEVIVFTAYDSYIDCFIQNGFLVEKLPLHWDDWDYGIEYLQNAILKYNVSLLFVDSYKVTKNFFSEISNVVSVFYIDDFCKEVFPIKAVLHYSEFKDESIIADLYKETDTICFSGMKYIPLREGFNVLGKHNRYDLLVTTGGSDPYSITKRILTKLMHLDDWLDKNICVVLGKMNDDEDFIRELIKDNNRITVLKNIPNMNDVIAESRIAITAGGITVYELMALEVVFSCFSFTDDQKPFCKKMEAHDYCTYSGDARENADLVVDSLINNISNLVRMDRKQLVSKAKYNKAIVDGNGAKRIAEEIIKIVSTHKEKVDLLT